MWGLDVDSTAGSAGGSPTPSLLDSPTLARVERATARHEGGKATLRQAACCQSLLNGMCGERLEACGEASEAIKRGLVWQQRDRLFSRWKQRFCVLTRDYLICFKRATDPVSHMGAFLFKVKLVGVERVGWINRRHYSVVALDVTQEGRLLLRADCGLEDWFELLEECVLSSKERRRALRVSRDASYQHDGHTSNSLSSVNSSLEEWLGLARRKIAGLQQNLNSDLALDLSNLNYSRPHSIAPDLHTPSQSRPQSAVPDISTPNRSRPQSNAPDLPNPNRSRPHSIAPDFHTPSQSRPQSAVPDLSTPNKGRPQSIAPDLHSPNRSHPQSMAPDIPSPNRSRPQSIGSDLHSSNRSHPQSMAPDIPSPNRSRPQSIGPDLHSSNRSHPQSMAPDIPSPNRSQPQSRTLRHVDSYTDNQDENQDQDQDQEQWIRRRTTHQEDRLRLNDTSALCGDKREAGLQSGKPDCRGAQHSYHLNSDVFFMSPPGSVRAPSDRLLGRPVLTPVGSFRSTYLFKPNSLEASLASRHRDRSQSDVRQMWRPEERRTKYITHATQV